MSRWIQPNLLSARNGRDTASSRSMKARYKIVVSAEPGRCNRFRWEIAPPGVAGPRLESGYLFASRRAAILDARFFLFREGRLGIVETVGEQ